VDDPLAGQKFEAGSPGVVVKEAFRALHPLDSGSFQKAETGHEDTFELRPDEAGTSYLRERVRAGGTLMIVAVPDDEVAATYFGVRAEPEDRRPRLAIGGGPAK
jgi:hypothetical protein